MRDIDIVSIRRCHLVERLASPTGVLFRFVSFRSVSVRFLMSVPALSLAAIEPGLCESLCVCGGY